MPRPVLSKKLPRKAKLIQETGKFKLQNDLKHNSLTAIIRVKKVCLAGTLGKMFQPEIKKLGNNSTTVEWNSCYPTAQKSH